MAETLQSNPELEAHVQRVLRVRMPTGPGISLTAALFRRWFKPSFSGLERLPSKPALFVGNHALLAVDAFVFHLLMHYDYGRFLRPLGDKTLFANQQYADAVINLGAALGHAQVVTALMAEQKDLLLYPGGTYEAVKQPEQRYELMWKERYGFIRLAAKMGYTIVPFAAVGPDEYFDQHLTGPEVQQAQLTQLLMRVGLLPEDLRSDLIPPLPAGVLGSPIPKPKTTFYSFCPPVDLSGYRGRDITDKQQVKIRAGVEDAIDLEIKNLLLRREQQRHNDGLLRRILSL
ncbi:MAG: 1-acyl-sn-glycerol-3-phosphate acyltransferase [Luminiphilus sp.]|nr:1-acyl-sn-glycerol-3-phosphate acyltransferase [Luminiphilus sp.]